MTRYDLPGVGAEDEGTPLGNAVVLNFVGAGVTATPTGNGEVQVFIPGVPAGGTASPKMGNTVVVDAVNGNDTAGAVNGFPFLTVNAAFSYVAGLALPPGGVTIWVLPGTYTLTGGLTLRDGCSLRGLSVQTTRLTWNASVPGGTATMLTMGENTRVEDLSLTLSSSNATTNLVGLALPGTTSVTSKLRTSVLTLDNSGLGVGSNTEVYGVYCTGTGVLGAATFSFNMLKGITINVRSNGSGNKYGLYMPSSSASQISTRDINLYVAAPATATSTGLYVAIVTDNINSQVQLRTSSIAGSPYPAVQLKLPVVLRTDVNLVTLTGNPVIQGIALTSGNRVLVAAQAVATDNGIYVVDGPAGAWTRALDMAAGSAAFGAYTFVSGGTYVHTGWECTTVGNVGAVALTFTQRYAGGDILQNAPQAGSGTNGIQIGPGTDLVTKSACTHSFTTYVTPSTLLYCINAAISSSNAGTIRYAWPGTLVSAGDTTQVFYRFQQKSILQGMFMNLRVAPGIGNSVVVTVLKSATGVPGSGVPTSMIAVISGVSTSATNYLSSVDFGQFESLAVQITGIGNANSATDLTIELDLF